MTGETSEGKWMTLHNKQHDKGLKRPNCPYLWANEGQQLAENEYVYDQFCHALRTW